jgi:hypothetical protein
MASRCRICGTITNYVTICNSCNIAKEERRFLKLVNREELMSTRRIIDRQKKGSQTHATTGK